MYLLSFKSIRKAASLKIIGSLRVLSEGVALHQWLFSQYRQSNQQQERQAYTVAGEKEREIECVCCAAPSAVCLPVVPQSRRGGTIPILDKCTNKSSLWIIAHMEHYLAGGAAWI